MKTTKKNAGIKVTTGVKAGGVPTYNHNLRGLKVVSGVKAGMSFVRNHTSLVLRAQ